ncbi:BTB/POZ protein [Penicillium diatomitis]|uniref:BTB/POZ protein n=1 Tax=Penicillium diatomitis TaxID=2819901 RepID=A0A9W9WM65_9EURO|nr:BTB/POZ protein [Penicillium diatomitis]XP_056787161.1 BTB/POZ protein [Penicillium diatomitis]KAJ5469742.1 BTB/POZ protein [Penicillium diatomitis]KAJ5475408.1 BTB/POZ protein [Penicillium diatomitis]
MSELKDVLQDLLLRGRFSDMEILCQGITFRVHKAIVCTQSSYFYSAMCDGFKESIDRAINIEDDTPETMERVLSFLYLRDYNEDGHILQYHQPISTLAICDHDSSSSLSENKPEISEPANRVAFNNIEVFIAADKYAILPLKALATLKLSQWADKNWCSPMFNEVVQKVMTSVPQHELSLREVIADIISRHVFDLIQDPEIVRTLDSFGCLGSLVIMKLISNEMVKRPHDNYVLPLGTRISSSRRHR